MSALSHFRRSRCLESGIVNVWGLPRHRPSRIPTDWRGRAACQKGIEEEDARLERHGQDAIGVDLFVAGLPVAPPKHEKAAPCWLERYLAEGSRGSGLSQRSRRALPGASREVPASGRWPSTSGPRRAAPSRRRGVKHHSTRMHGLGRGARADAARTLARERPKAHGTRQRERTNSILVDPTSPSVSRT